MNKFILVHDAKDASPIVINAKSILCATKSDTLTGTTYIGLKDTDMEYTSAFVVTETPEKIFEMLNN